jgi:spore maturation protein CgeB
MKLLQVHEFYQGFLNDFYREHPSLCSEAHHLQIETLINSGFGVGHSLAPSMKALGWDARIIIANAIPAQISWAKEHNIAGSETLTAHELLRIQIEEFRPDILYITSPITFDARFVNSVSHKAKVVIGWRAAEIPVGTDFSCFDLVLSSHENSRLEALKHGAKSVMHFLPGVPDNLGAMLANTTPEFDVVFTGQCSPVHTRRIAMLQAVSKALLTDPDADYSIGFYIPEQPALPVGLCMHNQGARWGAAMFRALRSGKIVINAQIDICPTEAGNMRLFEATGVGSFLLTDYHPNIVQYFQPGVELETYSDEVQLVSKIKTYLKDEKSRFKIADAGRKRCLRENSMSIRAKQFEKLVLDRL